jgi:hypothetical protein
MEEHVDPQQKSENSPVQRLEELFKVLNIKEAYYVDDYNNIDFLPTVISNTKRLFLEDRAAEIDIIYEKRLELNVPDEDALGDQLIAVWEAMEEPDKLGVLHRTFEALQLDFNASDFEYTTQLKNSFPNGFLKCVSPDEWSELVNEISANPEEKVLILFDQDLTHAQNERFKNGTTKGQNLIVEVKASDIRENVYCALITHIIKDTSKELEERDRIINDADSRLNKGSRIAVRWHKKDFAKRLFRNRERALLKGDRRGPREGQNLI